MKFLVCGLLVFALAGANAQCPQDYEFLEGRCLRFVNSALLPFEEARAVCQATNGDLARVDECQVLGAIAEKIDSDDLDPDKNGFWIGAFDPLQNGQYQWVDNNSPVAMGAPFWGRGSGLSEEPQINNLEENCAGMLAGDGYYFHNLDCQFEYSDGKPSPLCQKEQENGMCTPPYEAVAGGCYQFLSMLQEDWESAQFTCESSQGNLAVIDDCNVLASLIKQIKETGRDPQVAYWIGGIRVGSRWMWVDGSSMPMGVPFWGREGTGELEPNEDSDNCVELNASDRYYFNDVSCQNELKYPLCETDSYWHPSSPPTHGPTSTSYWGTTPYPTSRYPTSPHPTSPHPTSRYPTSPYPTSRYPTSRYTTSPDPLSRASYRSTTPTNSYSTPYDSLKLKKSKRN